MQQNNPFKTPHGDFLLYRLPLQKQELLRPWDAADELMLEHLVSNPPANTRLQTIITNDSFGALTTALHQYHPINWSDSFIAHQAAIYNLKANQISTDQVTLLSSMDSPKTALDLVLIKVPKTLALLEDQLIKLKPFISKETQIIAGSMIKNLSPNTWKIFERIIGSTTTSLAKKKARLIFVKPDLNLKPVTSPYPEKYQLEDTEYMISNYANVFSRSSLDIGTRFLLEHLPENPACKDIIDLGCGNGIVGIMMQLRHPDARVHFTDESYMAIASAMENYQSIIGSPSKASFYTDDSLSEFTHKADLIICNPPFHQQNAISDQTALRMLNQAHKTLVKGGELWVIGNRHLKYQHALKRIFSNCRTIASNNKFSIYISHK